jgi:Zn finger protein HypA/HybF involved in hydrogenase expression
VEISMHEAGIASQAVDAAFAEAASAGLLGRQPAGLDVVIDPGRVTPDAIAFHLELALRDHGLDNLDVAITTEVTACPACGAPGSEDAWLLCETCGAPLPDRDGPIVEARFRY